ncbi:MAG TPA: hypothetical protein PLA93_06010 [Acinetobacter towneri]|nr:hypothetical protein [Acinetobacter towneri]
MLKMMDVLEHNLVQNFSHSLNQASDQLDELLNLNTSEEQLRNVMSAFFKREDALEAAQALDICQEDLQSLQAGLALKDEHLCDTAKIVALCLALETDSLAQVEIPDCLQDYPM